ncbi:LmbE family protein [Nitrosotalea sinensis]|uniref:LmbE family protein n=1 Tax=Nitrosotalea sinensis TaxID=1499975 RepID=A0A2H1EEI2_9ARCH|nr:PIG-L family deacetylase [Candidatus Nitrosotalea sinensis]SHO42674.1 LmbE family protein [Candidatus Nitrosotalea sinensis]
MNVLAVGAHWDDIELGCGLTLKKLKEKGHDVFTIVVCSSNYGKNMEEGMKEEEALEGGLRSFQSIGARYIATPKEPNSNLAYNRKIMQVLEDAANKNKIDLVFTHWFGDVNTDHRAVWEISRTSFRNVKNFIMYQSNSYSDHVNIFTPNLFFSYDEKDRRFKEQLLSQYATEWARRQDRWKREIFERERYWGFLSGKEYAEGFQSTNLVDFTI